MDALRFDEQWELEPHCRTNDPSLLRSPKWASLSTSFGKCYIRELAEDYSVEVIRQHSQNISEVIAIIRAHFRSEVLQDSGLFENSGAIQTSGCSKHAKSGDSGTKLFSSAMWNSFSTFCTHSFQVVNYVEWLFFHCAESIFFFAVLTKNFSFRVLLGGGESVPVIHPWCTPIIFASLSFRGFFHISALE